MRSKSVTKDKSGPKSELATASEKKNFKEADDSKFLKNESPIESSIKKK